MRTSTRVRRHTTAALGLLALLGGLVPTGAVHAAPDRIDPVTLTRGADPAVVHLVHDTIRDHGLAPGHGSRARPP